MECFEYVILGGGTTAGYAAKQFAEEGIGKNELCIISSEPDLPMDRPPISKGYLRGEIKKEKTFINSNDFYADHGVRVMLNTTARAVTFPEKVIRLENGEEISYNKLLIATGSRIKELAIPGNNLPQVYYLRTHSHADAIREAAKTAKHATILGGGFIGTEVAAGLVQLGVDVALVFPQDRILPYFSTKEIAKFIHAYYREKGMLVFSDDSAVEISGEGKVEKVLLASGNWLESDMVVAGIGVAPEISLFDHTQMETDDAIIVNEYCETSIDDVYAAGDVARFPDEIFHINRHIEHWQHAKDHGVHAAKVMMGKRDKYEFLPYFFSDIFDLSYEFWGDNTEADSHLYRGDVETKDFSAWWFKRDRLVAAFIMSDRPDEEREQAQKWIRDKSPVDKEELKTAEHVSH